MKDRNYLAEITLAIWSDPAVSKRWKQRPMLRKTPKRYRVWVTFEDIWEARKVGIRDYEWKVWRILFDHITGWRTLGEGQLWDTAAAFERRKFWYTYTAAQVSHFIEEPT